MLLINTIVALILPEEYILCFDGATVQCMEIMDVSFLQPSAVLIILSYIPYLSRVLDPQPHPHSILVGLLHRNRTLRQRLKVHTSLSREILQLLPVTSCSRGVD